MKTLTENRIYMEQRFNELSNSMSKIVTRVEKIETEHKNVCKTLEYYGGEIDDIKAQLAKIHDDKNMEQQERQKQEEQIRKQMTHIQHDKNRKTLIITGIPVTSNENLKYLSTKLADAMKVDLKETEIDTVYRSKKVAEGQHPNIVLKFNATSQRDLFYEGRKTISKNTITTTDLGLKEKNKIYINEWLNPQEQHLFYLARRKKSELGYQFAWTYNCQIFMRKSKATELIKVIDKKSLESLV